jgi:hypothetical protein
VVVVPGAVDDELIEALRRRYAKLAFFVLNGEESAPQTGVTVLPPIPAGLESEIENKHAQAMLAIRGSA